MINDEERLEKAGKQPKRKYTAPILSDYGSVSKVTQGGGYVGNNGNTKCDTGDATTSNIKCS